jgi:RimJ/RimL family protein N-acetyltransferase
LAAEVDRLCQRPGARHQAVVALEAGAVVGVASCERADDQDHRAEFSVFIADGHRDRGIGTLLLEHLAARACRLGITELIGEVLPGNTRMLRVAHDLSAHAWSRFDHGIVDVGIGLITADDQTQLSVDARERAAERASLRALLSPASVAVVGAGHTRRGVGHETLRALREYGFTGTLYAVNRTGHPIAGVPAYRSVRDLPRPVDLLIVAVPADQVIGVLADGASIGVRGAVVLSSGFGEDGETGRCRQTELVRLSRKHGIRLVGPN